MIPSPSQLLAQYGLSPKYSFGQNFLCDRHYTDKIAALAAPEPGLHVLELGAGLGALTDALLRRECSLAAVERDRDLVPVLSELFAAEVQSGRLQVIEEDAKKVDFAELLGRLSPSDQTASWVITGNLPYQITGPLLEKTVHLSRCIKRAVFLVQKEVADRLAATPSTKEYGALTVFVQAQFNVERAFVIKPGAFHPRPRVDSAVVVLRPHEQEVTLETPAFRQVVKLAFSARRKTLRNAWKALGSSDLLEQLAAACGTTLDQRGETLSPRQFALAGRTLEMLRGGVSSGD
jgi:16S rRNA (adenine1518-N6/adenine1519-N6)-dimethyltransferase